MPTITIIFSIISLITGIIAMLGAALGASAIKHKLETEGAKTGLVIDLLSWMEKRLPTSITGMR